jgi:hypothetical protein
MARRLATIVLLAVLLAAPGAVRADIVFSNFGPGFSSQNSGYVVGGYPNVALGATFTPSNDYSLTDLYIALSSTSTSNADTLRVDLRSDSGSASPGAIIASVFVAPGTLGVLGNNNPPLHFAVGGIAVFAGNQYWTTVEDISGGGEVNAWNLSSTTNDGFAVSGDGGSTWFSFGGPVATGVYEWDGSAPGLSVLEPGTLALLASGAIALAGRQLRRRFL